MAGVVAPDKGRMMLEGREVVFPDPAAAMAAGVACIFQELSLIPDLTVADNIVISHPPKRWGMIDRRAQRRIAEQALARPAARTSTLWRRSRTCRCRAARSWRSPRPWRASPAF
jgi:ABC-type sugar transport system, ATPase component